MLSDDDNLLDLHISHYYVHVTQPQRIMELSEENRSSDSMSINPHSKINHLCDDSLDVIHQEMDIKKIDSILQQQKSSIHSLNLLNNMHHQVRQFVKTNFGASGLELIPVELFTNYLIKEFETMFNYSDIEGIRVKLLQYLTMRMGGSFIDIEKLSNATKANGLIGFVSTFMTNIQFQTGQGSNKSQSISNGIPVQIQDSKKQTLNIQCIIKSFAQKLFHNFEKELEIKLNAQMTKISEKYNVALTMLYKVEKKADIIDNKKYRKQIQGLNKKIQELQIQIKRTQNQLVISKENNSKLTEENLKYQQKIQKLNDHIKVLELSKQQSIPYAIASPSNHNTSFDKTKLDQVFICHTPKSQKSRLVLIPQIANKGRSFSSVNLELNTTCLSARQNPQQIHQHRRMKTEEEIGRTEVLRPNRNQSIKKNSQVICPKTRPTKMIPKKNNSTWKV